MTGNLARLLIVSTLAALVACGGDPKDQIDPPASSSGGSTTAGSSGGSISTGGSTTGGIATGGTACTTVGQKCGGQFHGCCSTPGSGECEDSPSDPAISVCTCRPDGYVVIGSPETCCSGGFANVWGSETISACCTPPGNRPGSQGTCCGAMLGMFTNEEEIDGGVLCVNPDLTDAGAVPCVTLLDDAGFCMAP